MWMLMLHFSDRLAPTCPTIFIGLKQRLLVQTFRFTTFALNFHLAALRFFNSLLVC
jgi:hypothetical protein